MRRHPDTLLPSPLCVRQSPLLSMSERQQDIMYALAGCSDVMFLISRVQSEVRGAFVSLPLPLVSGVLALRLQVRKAIEEVYGVSKFNFALWFKNRGRNPCKISPPQGPVKRFDLPIEGMPPHKRPHLLDALLNRAAPLRLGGQRPASQPTTNGAPQPGAVDVRQLLQNQIQLKLQLQALPGGGEPQWLDPLQQGPPRNQPQQQQLSVASPTASLQQQPMQQQPQQISGMQSNASGGGPGGGGGSLQASLVQLLAQQQQQQQRQMGGVTLGLPAGSGPATLPLLSNGMLGNCVTIQVADLNSFLQQQQLIRDNSQVSATLQHQIPVLQLPSYINLGASFVRPQQHLVGGQPYVILQPHDWSNLTIAAAAPAGSATLSSAPPEAHFPRPPVQVVRGPA